MLKLCNICKTFNKDTIDEKVLFSNFDMEIKKGDFVSVVGSNGSGKTTLLNIISGDIPIDSGNIILQNEDLSKQKNYIRAKKIGRVFQNPAWGTCSTMTIFENMSVADNKLKPYNLTMGLNKKRKEFYQSQLELLKMGLENRMNVKTGSLSGGQRQALALIMATMVTPELILFDEHTAALDPKSSNTVMELTKSIVSQKHITALMVTHNLRHATQFGTRTVMMHEGKSILDIEKSKTQITVEELLKTFNEISIECGN